MGLLAKIGKRILGIGTKKPSESLVGTVVGRLIPDKNKRNELMLEIEKAFNEQQFKLDSEFMDVVKDAQKMHEFEPKVGLLLKGSSRWIIALMFSCFYIYARLSGLELTSFDTQLMAGLWGFLFLSRGLEKILRRN